MLLCIYVHLGSPSPIVDIRGIRSHLATGSSLGDSHRANWYLIRRLGDTVVTPPNVFLIQTKLISYHAYLHIDIYIRLGSPSSIVTHTWVWESPGDWLLIRRQSSGELALH